jgi:type III restriction enzyme
VDEPQSVDGGLEGRGKEALDAMNPLCTLRYSATHADKHHMLYRLDAVDAYERKLVKQIEVASLEVKGGHNRCYVKLISTTNKRGTFSAKVELDVQRMFEVSRETVTNQQLTRRRKGLNERKNQDWGRHLSPCSRNLHPGILRYITRYL